MHFSHVTEVEPPFLVQNLAAPNHKGVKHDGKVQNREDNRSSYVRNTLSLQAKELQDITSLQESFSSVLRAKHLTLNVARVQVSSTEHHFPH